MNFKHELQSLLSFIKKPVYDEIRNPNNLKAKFKLFFFILLLDLVLDYLLMGVFHLIKYLGYEDIEKQNNVNDILRFPLWVAGVLMIIAAPFIEEVIFRYHLKFRKGYWGRKFPQIFYASTLLFALIHISNYSLNNKILLLTPLLVMPQFILGFFAGYLRVKFGFMWGTFLHIMHNAILTIPFIIMMLNTFEPISIKNKEFTLNVKKRSSWNNASNDTEYGDSYSFNILRLKNYSFKDCMSVLLDKHESLVEVPEEVGSTKLDLEYKSYRKFTDSVQERKWNRHNILDILKQKYGFKIISKKEYQSRIKVAVIDSLLFMKHRVDSEIKNATADSKDDYALYSVTINSKIKKTTADSMRVYPENVRADITIKPHETVIKNGTINNLMHMLSDQFGQEVFITEPKFNIESHYDLKYPKMTLKELKEYFKTHFGIDLISESKKVKVSEIVFEFE